MNKESLKPIIDRNSKILILGSMAGDKSLENGEYYSNESNHFWNIICNVFDFKEELKTYNDKIHFLKKYHIALWDIYEQVERNGSRDINIKNAKFNDLKTLLSEYDNIKLILLNGKETEKAFISYIENDNIESFIKEKGIKYQYVSSSSGANAIKIELKIEEWKNAININIK